MKVSKTQICNKLIQEADAVISVMLAMKAYCNQVITEQEEDCSGYRGDAGNDPENKPKNNFRRPKASQHLMENVVSPAIDKHDANNDFLTVDCCEDILGFLESSYEVLEIPDELMEDKEYDFSEDSEVNEQCQGCHYHCHENSKEKEFHPGVMAFDSLEDLFRFLMR